MGAWSKHINDLIASRRALLGGLVGLPLLDLAACADARIARRDAEHGLVIYLGSGDQRRQRHAAAGLSWRKLIAWGDALFDGADAPFDPDAMTRADQERRFGQNNDMLALFRGRSTRSRRRRPGSADPLRQQRIRLARTRCSPRCAQPR